MNSKKSKFDQKTYLITPQAFAIFALLHVFSIQTAYSNGRNFGDLGILCKNENGRITISKGTSSTVLFQLKEKKLKSSLEALWSTGIMRSHKEARGKIAEIIHDDNQGGEFFSLHTTTSYSQYRRTGMEKFPKYLFQIYGPISTNAANKQNAKLRSFIQEDSKKVILTQRLKCQINQNKSVSSEEQAFESLALQTLDIIKKEIAFLISQIQKRLIQHDQANTGPLLVKDEALEQIKLPVPTPNAIQAVINRNIIFQLAWIKKTEGIKDHERRHRKEIKALSQDLKQTLVRMHIILDELKDKEDKDGRICALRKDFHHFIKWASETLIFKLNGSRLSELVLPLNQVAEAEIQCER